MLPFRPSRVDWLTLAGKYHSVTPFPEQVPIILVAELIGVDDGTDGNADALMVFVHDDVTGTFEGATAGSTVDAVKNLLLGGFV